MEKTETTESYTLLLTTSNTNNNKQNNPVHRADTIGNLSNVTWNVDYDSLFMNRQKLFKHCRVRFNLLGAAENYSSFNAQTGYLCANFASNYNASTTDLTTILGLVYPKTNENTTLALPALPKGYNVSTLDEIGVDINIEQLYGRQFLNLRLINDDSFSIIKNITSNNWEIMLLFTFYN